MGGGERMIIKINLERNLKEIKDKDVDITSFLVFYHLSILSG